MEKLNIEIFEEIIVVDEKTLYFCDKQRKPKII
jgi:hypothetical protein